MKVVANVISFINKAATVVKIIGIVTRTLEFVKDELLKEFKSNELDKMLKDGEKQK